jgi:hypothetical protein
LQEGNCPVHDTTQKPVLDTSDQEEPISAQLGKAAMAVFARNLAGDSKVQANAWKPPESIEFHGVVQCVQNRIILITLLTGGKVQSAVLWNPPDTTSMCHPYDTFYSCGLQEISSVANRVMYRSVQRPAMACQTEISVSPSVMVTEY